LRQFWGMVVDKKTGCSSRSARSSRGIVLSVPSPSFARAIPLKTRALTGGKPLTIVCPWQSAIIHPKFLSPLNPDTGSPREGAKRLKTIDWVYWKISSTPFLVDGVSWSSLAGGALRSTQAKSLIEPSDRIHVGPSGGDGHRCYCAGRQPVGAMVAGNFGGYRRVGTSRR
jgi:hypothetical protein